MSGHQAVILCGGKGTRLRDYWDGPKSLVPVLGKPFLAWQVEALCAAGFGRFCFVCGPDEKLGHFCIGELQSHVSFAFNRSVIHDRQEGTAEALRFAHQYHALDDRFLVVYGDSYLDFAWGAAALAYCGAAVSKLAAVWCVQPLDGDAGCGANIILEAGNKFVEEYLPDGAYFTHLDYGAIAMRREYVSQLEGDHLGEALGKLAGQRLVRALEVPEAPHEVGTPEGVRRLEAFLREVRT